MSAHQTASEHVFELPATAAAAGLARRELAGTPGLGLLAYNALLMTSELIAVFVQDIEPRPGATLRLSIRVTPDRVRIEVGGQPLGASADALLNSRETPSLGGFGLQIVERMADAWGIDAGRGSTIWFEMTR